MRSPIRFSAINDSAASPSTWRLRCPFDWSPDDTSSGSNGGSEEAEAVGEVVFLLIRVSFARPTDVKPGSKVVCNTMLLGLDAFFGSREVRVFKILKPPQPSDALHELNPMIAARMIPV